MSRTMTCVNLFYKYTTQRSNTSHDHETMLFYIFAPALAHVQSWHDGEINISTSSYVTTGLADKLERRKLARETTEMKRALERHEIIEEVSKLGEEWKTPEQCDQFIQRSSTNARPAIIWQLKYHKKVFPDTSRGPYPVPTTDKGKDVNEHRTGH